MLLVSGNNVFDAADVQPNHHRNQYGASRDVQPGGNTLLRCEEEHHQAEQPDDNGICGYSPAVGIFHFAKEPDGAHRGTTLKQVVLVRNQYVGRKEDHDRHHLNRGTHLVWNRWIDHHVEHEQRSVDHADAQQERLDFVVGAHD